MLNLILNLKKNESIENLYIDLKLMQDFVPENQWGQEHFVPVSHMIASMQLILNDGVNEEQENGPEE